MDSVGRTPASTVTDNPAAAVVLQSGGLAAAADRAILPWSTVMKLRQPAGVSTPEQRRPVEWATGAVLGRAYTIPFNPDARKLQEIYHELLKTLPAFDKYAQAEEDDVRCWL